jgi:fatty-acyl-CoA synthase
MRPDDREDGGERVSRSDGDGKRAPAYAHGLHDVPLLGETIGENFDRIASLHGAREALVSCHQGIRLTYEELHEAVSRLASGLLERGIAKGDRVGMWAPNCVEWVLVQYATAAIGAVLVNVNPAYRTHELAYALRQSGVRLLVSTPAHGTSDYAAMVVETRTELPALEEAIFLGSSEWAGLCSHAVDAAALQERATTLSFDDPINIQYTSGTTGYPKGATLSHHNILNNAFFVAELLDYGVEDRVCLPVPFYHCFGMVMGNLGATSHGSCIVIPGASFDAGATLAAVAGERCTSLYGVPTMFIAELAHPDFATFDLGSLRTGIMAGAPCPVEVMRRVVSDMHMSEVSICYGMTETSPVSTQTRRHDSLERRVGSVGRVGPHVQVKVVDPATGLVVRRGERGELCTRGYSVMLGYWDQPEQTAEAIDAAGWMHTGDLATMDDDGYLNIVGRIKDMIIRGGENVYPREVEEFLYTHPAIADVQVVGVPDERYGEIVCAWIVLGPGETLDEHGVREFCEGRIARFKIPQLVRFVDAFPMTVTGKIQKFRIREAEIAERGLTEAQTA